MSEQAHPAAQTGAHDHSKPSGRSVEALGLCVPDADCRRTGHVLVRTKLPQTGTQTEPVGEICLTCTEQVGRLEGLRLWQSVCPCCFSSAFPGGLPSLSQAHPRTLTERPSG